MPAPDLIESSVGNPPASVKRGRAFALADTVLNQGTAPAGASKTRYYLSVDGNKNAGDKRLNGERAVPALAPAATSVGTATSLTVPPDTAVGAYFVVACADDKADVSESNEQNNCTASLSTVQITK